MLVKTFGTEVFDVIEQSPGPEPSPKPFPASVGVTERATNRPSRGPMMHQGDICTWRGRHLRWR
jgi:hypothetical protein